MTNEMLEYMFINIDMEEMPKYAKLAGVSFGNRQNIIISKLQKNIKLNLKRDYKNEYDKNAIGVYYNNDLVGWIPKYLAKKMAPEIDLGIKWEAIIKDITGDQHKTKGINIELISEI